MTAENNTTEPKDKEFEIKTGGSSDAVYGIGVIGALVYYIGRATTTEERVKGFFKGLAWPAFLVYELLEFLNKE
jgi:hypothetical protein